MDEILDIKKKISKLLAKQKENVNIEVEAKFGIYKNHFYSGVISFYFDRIKKCFENQLCLEKSTVYICNEERKILYEIIGGEKKEKVIYEKKKNLDHFEYPDYNVRISVNEECEIENVSEDFVPTSIRIRERNFIIFEDKYRLDITHVVDELKTEYKDSFEIEIELLNFDYFEEFVEFISSVFKMLHRTELVYTISEKELLNTEIGEILNHDKHMKFKYAVESKNFRKGPFIYKSCLVEPRNLTKRDICYAGFFGKASPYFLTFKADGLRKLLIVHSTGLWLVYPPFEYNLILRPGDNKLYSQLMKNKLFVIDGELVKSANSTNPINSKYRFLAFDCLAKYYNTDKDNYHDFSQSYDIQYKNLDERMASVQNFFINNLYQLKNPKKTVAIEKEISKLYSLINVEMKYGITLNKQKFFEQITEMQNLKVDYKTDGFIFTPKNSEYNNFSQLMTGTRILENIPDVCKLKDYSQITIDFMVVRNDQNKIELYVAKDYNNGGHSEAIPFKGSKYYPDVKVDQDNELTMNVRSGTIVEYSWDCKRLLLTPKLIRTDKQAANRYAVVLNNWKDLMNPITNEDISGKSLKLVFTYHNKIKQYLYKKLDTESHILDIGSGMGGDINKWRDFSGHILGVEPDEEHIKIALERLENVDFQKRVKIMQAYGQETKKIRENVISHIPGGKVDAVTFMLSLSYFWKSKKDLDSLCQTIVQNIKSSGIVLFMTVDGDLLENKIELERKIKFSDCAEYSIYYNKDIIFGKKVRVKIESSKTVGERDEYLVHIKALTKRLAKYGFKLVEHQVANKEELLSNFQKEYSSIYSYGYYQR